MILKPASFVLASLLTAYPSSVLEESVDVLLADPDLEMPKDLQELVKTRVSKENLLDLQSEYIDIFDRGRSANPVYETEYGRHRALAKGNELSDIAGFYHAFGFELASDRENMDMLDHASIELEFYALLLMKQIHLNEINSVEGVYVVEDGRKKFLQAHLGRFIAAIGTRPGVQESEYYRSVYGWVADLVEKECKDLQLEIDIVDWILGESKKEEEMNCEVAGAGLAKPCV